jgi:signal transduction histidine kinase
VRRAWWVWVWFGVGAAALVAAMAWVTIDMRAMASAAAISRHQEQIDFAARAALWRMDSALAALIAAEASDAGADLTSGPFASLKLVRFHKSSDGAMTRLDGAGAGEATAWAERLRSLPSEEPVASYGQHEQVELQAQLEPPAQQAQAVKGDYNIRQQLNAQITANGWPHDTLGAPRALWLGKDAISIVRTGQGCAAAGVAVEAGALQDALKSQIADLLPDARITAAPADLASAAYPLAAMPLQLDPGRTVSEQLGGLQRDSALGPALAIAWICVVAVVVAMAVLLAGAMALAERRAAFVSAVTHELRTPITSLRLYADMLGEGMVADEARRGEYLATIRGEADRLGRLVENVLAYARLERSPDSASQKSLVVGEVIAPCRERLERRAREAGMELAVELGETAGIAVRVDPTLVEQALFNLVDNACKYAAGAKDRRIELRGERRDGALALLVSDHGPGIAADMRARLFRPFSRSAREAAGSAPGVGLGLALSRRLARRFGGDLALVASSEGASFALTLPLA